MQQYMSGFWAHTRTAYLAQKLYTIYMITCNRTGTFASPPTVTDPVFMRSLQITFGTVCVL